MAPRKPKSIDPDKRVNELAHKLADIVVAMGDEPCPKCEALSLTFEAGHNLQILCENESCGFRRFYSYSAARAKRGTVAQLVPKPQTGVIIDEIPESDHVSVRTHPSEARPESSC